MVSLFLAPLFKSGCRPKDIGCNGRFPQDCTHNWVQSLSGVTFACLTDAIGAVLVASVTL